MRHLSYLLLGLLLVGSTTSCSFVKQKLGLGGDSLATDSMPLHDTIPLSAKPLASAADLDYEIVVVDSTVSGQLDDYDDLYLTVPGHFCFRNNLGRQADFGGTVKGTPRKIVKLWEYVTGTDYTQTVVGAFGGGTGWTGQPVYVEWPDSLMARFKQTPAAALTPDFGKREVMVGSLCGDLCFINFDTGKASREPLPVGNPIKGSISLDPRLNGNVYVGQGVPAHPPIGHLGLNLFTRQQLYFSGVDKEAWRGWGGNDASPIMVGGFAFFLSENGTVYKYNVHGDKMTLHSLLRYRPKGEHGAAGMENSMCVYKNYGIFGDNKGHVVCIDLNTLQPIWHYDNHDDIDGTIVLEVTGGKPYVYCGCEVDQQGTTGICHFVKLDALTGRLVWEQPIECKKLGTAKKHFDGGLYCTPLLGHGDCEGLIFASITQREGSSKAELTAFDTKTGQVRYRTQLNYFAWSSPVAFYNEKNELFIVVGDSHGELYLLRGKTGQILYSERLGDNFESSPVVAGNQFVVGSRGTKILKFEVQ